MGEATTLLLPGSYTIPQRHIENISHISEQPWSLMIVSFNCQQSKISWKESLDAELSTLG